MWQRVKQWFSDKGKEFKSYILESSQEPGLLARSSAVGFTLGLSPIPGELPLACNVSRVELHCSAFAVNAGISTLLALGAIWAVKICGWPLHAGMTLFANLCSVPIEVRASQWAWGALWVVGLGL